jgi:hypothetical protein
LKECNHGCRPFVNESERSISGPTDNSVAVAFG